MTSLERVFQLAVRHVADTPATEASARLALRDARTLEQWGDYRGARRRALRSLAYAVGVSHAAYREAAE